MDVVRLSKAAEKKKAQHTNNPHEFHLVRGLDLISNDRKTFMRIDQFYNGHCPDQKEEDGGDFTEVVQQVFFHVVNVMSGHDV
jgi:hypothetical protein